MTHPFIETGRLGPSWIAGIDQGKQYAERLGIGRCGLTRVLFAEQPPCRVIAQERVEYEIDAMTSAQDPSFPLGTLRPLSPFGRRLRCRETRRYPVRDSRLLRALSLTD